MANSQEQIILVYDVIEHEDDIGYYISFGDDIGVYILKSLSLIDSDWKTLEIPLWFAEAKEIECYEE